jgi:hypothetical protein
MTSRQSSASFSIAGALGACLLGSIALGCDGGVRGPAALAPSPLPRAAAGGQREVGRQPSLRRLEPCVPVSYEVCSNALDDNCNGALEEGCGTPAGVVQFMIAWDAPRADVDLHVIDPNGELIEAGRLSKSGLLKGRDCPGRRQECAGTNLENVFLDGTKAPTRGTYKVSVALESLAGDEPPIWVTLSLRLGSRRDAFEIGLFEAEHEKLLEFSL